MWGPSGGAWPPAPPTSYATDRYRVEVGGLACEYHMGRMGDLRERGWLVAQEYMCLIMEGGGGLT